MEEGGGGESKLFENPTFKKIFVRIKEQYFVGLLKQTRKKNVCITRNYAALVLIRNVSNVFKAINNL